MMTRPGWTGCGRMNRTAPERQVPEDKQTVRVTESAPRNHRVFCPTKASAGWTLLLLLLAGMYAPQAMAAELQDLTRLVGEDVGLCVQLRSPASHLRRLEKSPLAMRLQTIKVYQRWLGSKGFRQLKAAAAYIETLAQKPFRELMEDLFGESVVVALYPGGGQEPAVVLLTRAASEQDLIEALEVWQQVDGRKATPVTYADQKYHRWSKPGEGGDQEVQFYWTQGRTLCLSNSEKALRKTIDFASRSGPGSPGKKPLAESTPFRAAVSELAANVVAVAYLNPRAWDSQVERSADNRMFVELWHRCQSVVLSVALDPGIRVTENVRWRPTTAEVPAQPHGDGEPLAVARCLAGVPPEALLVACGKLRVAPDWIDRFVELIPPNDRREIAGLRRVLRGLLLGFDLFSDVLPECQGNWSAFVVASDQKQSNRLPIDAAIRIPVPRDKRLSSDSSGTTVYNALDNALSAGANLLGAVRNAESTGPLVVLRQKGEGLDRVRWLDGLGICEPAYGWTDSALYLATSPAVIRSWMDRAKSGQPAGEVLRMSRSLPRDVDQAVLLNVRRVRSVLRDRQSFLVQHLSARNPSKRQRVAGDLEAIADMLRLLDFVYLTIRSSEESFEITFGGDLF